MELAGNLTGRHERNQRRSTRGAEKRGRGQRECAREREKKKKRNDKEREREREGRQSAREE